MTIDESLKATLHCLARRPLRQHPSLQLENRRTEHGDEHDHHDGTPSRISRYCMALSANMADQRTHSIRAPWIIIC